MAAPCFPRIRLRQCLFYYTPQANGPFGSVPFPYTVAESGTDVPGGLIGPPGRDEHIITTYRDNCRQQEVYQLYQSNLYTPNPGGNSQAGVIYSLITFSTRVTAPMPPRLSYRRLRCI